MGSHKFNTNSQYNDGSLLITRRSRCARSVTDFLPCSKCGAFYKKRNLYKHTRICYVQTHRSSIPESKKASGRHHPTANTA